MSAPQRWGLRARRPFAVGASPVRGGTRERGAQEGALGCPQGWLHLHVPGGTAEEGAVCPVFVLANGEVKLVVFQVRGSTHPAFCCLHAGAIVTPSAPRCPPGWAGLTERHVCPPTSCQHPRLQNQCEHLRLLSWHPANEPGAPGCCFFHFGVVLVQPGGAGCPRTVAAPPVQVPGRGTAPCRR